MRTKVGSCRHLAHCIYADLKSQVQPNMYMLARCTQVTEPHSKPQPDGRPSSSGTFNMRKIIMMSSPVATAPSSLTRLKPKK